MAESRNSRDRSDRGDRGDRGDRRDGPPQQSSQPKQPITKISEGGVHYIDYKETETLRRLTSGNGKISSRRRSGATAHEQRMLANAIKRARHMALLPYTNSLQ